MEKKKLKSIEQLESLLAEKKPFLITANSSKGAFYKQLDWDNEWNDEASEMCSKELNCELFDFINLEYCTIICDENGYNKRLEINDFATYMVKGSPIVGNVIVAFPNQAE